jgi:hypothetical protein
MTDSTITALDPATLPLSDEMLPCVQDGDNRRAPAAALGIPIASTEAPEPLAQYQTWIDESTAPPTLNVYIGSAWKPLYAFDTTGAMTFSRPVGLAAGDELGTALIFRGVLDCSTDPNYLAGDQGDFYVVSVPGKIGGVSGVDVETGDTLLCMVDGTDAGTQADVGANWTIGQGNIDGAVTGPASAADGNFALFDGTSGKLIADGGLSLDTDGTFLANSDASIPSQKAVKTYVDSVAQGLSIKPSVKAASTASLTHSGTQTIDGISCIAGDRVLDKNNSSPALNGIWIVASGSWTRAADMDSWAEIPGAFCFVEQGTTNGNTGWTCTSAPGGTLGTTAITWTQFSGAGTYTAGFGLSLTGGQFSALTGSSGTQAWSAELDAVAALSTTGLVARTAAHTYTPRVMSAPTAGMTITNPDGVSGNPAFVLANDLAALEALNATGIAARTGADSWAQRSLTQPAAGIAISNADGSAGNPTFALANDLAALEALSTTGIAARTGADSWAQRSLTQPAAGITISNADGSAGNPTFALANDLAALEGLASTGLAARTTTDTWAQRTLTAPAAGMTITNPGGVAGNPTFALANDLAALEGLSSTGLAVRTTTDTWTQRAIAGTTGEIAVTNGDGVAGAPTLGLPSSLTFTGKTVTGGTFSSPTAITGLPDPTNAQDAATKNYVDSLAQGLDVKPSVKAASTASLTHSGTQTIDGISCVAGDRVLEKNNSSPALNGIWIVASGAWTRATDMDSWTEIPGAFCFVEQGTTNGNTGWVCTSDQGGTLGTTAITWVQFAGVGTFTAGPGLLLTGTQFSATIGSSGGSEAWSTELDAVAALSTTGLVARTAAHTYNPRTMSAPAAGVTITNPDGVSGNPTFALANDLAALEGLSATGIAVRTAADTWAQRSLTAPAAGMTISNSDGSAGNPTFALANDLAALEGLTSTGLAVRTTTDTWAQRSLTQPAAGLTIANPDGVSGSPTFALANDLAALEGLASTGIAVRTGADSWAQRSIAVPTGLSINNPDGVSGNPTLALANDLAALEGLASTGIAVRTTTDTWTQRAIAGTAGEIAVANGDGVAGAPTLGLPSSLTFTGKTVTGGTFSSPAAITGLPDPSGTQDAATKNYVDTSVQGLDAKPSVKAASTSSLIHTGTQTIDGVSCVAGDRVLDKDNSTASLRGIWVVASGSWTRAADLSSWSQVPGAFCFVEQGTVNGDTGWLCTADQGGTLGTTAIAWTQFSGPGAYEASSAELDAVAALSTTGLVARTGAHTYVPRAIAGTAGEIAVSNGDGVAATPTLGLPVSLTFTGKTVTGGTFSSPAAITGLPDPSGAQDAATKNYVDTTAQGLDAKPSVKAASTIGSPLVHSGLQTIDGVSCVAGDRVLDKTNSNAANNGIWIVSSGSWSRAPDMDNWSKVPGAFCFVEQGTANGDTGWYCTADQGGTIGTTLMPWTQFAGPGAYEASSAELDALAALNTTGLVARTAAQTYTPRSIAVPLTGLSITNGNGVSGNPTLALANDLAALEALSGTNNIYYRSGTDTWSSVSYGGMISWSTGTLNVSPSTDTTLGGGSPVDTAVPSQKAVRTYANANIGGQAISTDTLKQGQAWTWDGQSSTFKACDVVEPNLIVNPSFDVYQEFGSYTFGGSAAKTHIIDFWKVGGNTSNAYTAALVTGIGGSQYSLNIKRNSGQTTANRVRLAQQFGQTEAMYLAGKTVVVSFDFMIGANYSPTSGPFVSLLGGTGIDEDLDLHLNGTLGFATGGVSTTTGSLTSQVAAAGTVARIITPALTVPSSITEFAIEFHGSAFVGTAGADDSFTIGNVKLEVGSIATPYRKPDYASELIRCQRRYQKSFIVGNSIQQGAGALSGETRWRRATSGTGSEAFQIKLFTPMRPFPSVTFYNPVSLNAQVRNETGNADCSATGGQNAGDASFEVVCTGNSGGAVGDWLGVHWVADARL